MSRYQKCKANLDFTEARDSEWQWHQLGCMQVCTLLQTENYASTLSLMIFTGRMPFLPPNQQSQSTEGNKQKQQETTHILQIHTTVFSQWKVPGPMWQHFRHNVQNVGFY